jgi:hypothetical protein
VNDGQAKMMQTSEDSKCNGVIVLIHPKLTQ